MMLSADYTVNLEDLTPSLRFEDTGYSISFKANAINNGTGSATLRVTWQIEDRGGDEALDSADLDGSLTGYVDISTSGSGSSATVVRGIVDDFICEKDITARAKITGVSVISGSGTAELGSTVNGGDFTIKDDEVQFHLYDADGGSTEIEEIYVPRGYSGGEDVIIKTKDAYGNLVAGVPFSLEIEGDGKDWSELIGNDPVVTDSNGGYEAKLITNWDGVGSKPDRFDSTAGWPNHTGS